MQGLTGLLPLMVLMDPQHGEERLRQVASQIERIPDEGVRADIAAATAVLAGVALDKELVKRILGEMTMRESAIYQEWRQEALAEGIQRGKQEGIQQTARNLLAMGLDPQQIATATGLTLEQIRQLQN
ncbi:MAG: Rpn family recombination-promoting nuclease/putative transposase [Synechococcaceae cyanobacterium SM2_3_2]|nr:Rpn family recombination-promoting nuclease/putative transposase [Synechococcaceae cyanobacterium SM2_3_2]